MGEIPFWGDFLFLWVCVFRHRHSLSMPVYTKRKIWRNIFCQCDFIIIGIMLLLNWYSIHCDWVRYFWLKWLKGKDWIFHDWGDVIRWNMKTCLHLQKHIKTRGIRQMPEIFKFLWGFLICTANSVYSDLCKGPGP